MYLIVLLKGSSIRRTNWSVEIGQSINIHIVEGEGIRVWEIALQSSSIGEWKFWIEYLQITESTIKWPIPLAFRGVG